MGREGSLRAALAEISCDTHCVMHAVSGGITYLNVKRTNAPAARQIQIYFHARFVWHTVCLFALVMRIIQYQGVTPCSAKLADTADGPYTVGLEG